VTPRKSYAERLREVIVTAQALGYRLVPVEPKGKLFGPRCRECGMRIVHGTGELIEGRCGPCATAEIAKQEHAA
jgi:hypothetical protein